MSKPRLSLNNINPTPASGQEASPQALSPRAARSEDDWGQADPDQDVAPGCIWLLEMLDDIFPPGTMGAPPCPYDGAGT